MKYIFSKFLKGVGKLFSKSFLTKKVLIYESDI